MAHDAAMLGVSVDPLALYRCDDPNALMWLSIVLERVSDTNREEARKYRVK